MINKETNRLAEKDWNQIKDYVTQILPQLLTQQPEIVNTIENMIAQQFPRRDEFARMLDEIKLFREETHQHFMQVNRRIELVEKRVEQVEQRIEQTEHRLDLWREEVNQRFKEVEQRFDKVEQRLDEQHRDMLDIKRRVIKVESNMERVLDKIDKFDAWLKITTGNVEDVKGQALEEMFALGLSYGLKNPDIKSETIQLRQHFVDTDGLVFPIKNKWIEVDIIAEDGRLTVFEIKASAVETDTAIFARKVELVQRQNPDKQVRGIFISLGAREGVKKCCLELGLELIELERQIH